MALTKDGAVYTWGHNASGQVRRPQASGRKGSPQIVIAPAVLVADNLKATAPC